MKHARSRARRKDAMCFLRWIISVIPYAVVLACQHYARYGLTTESLVSSLSLIYFINVKLRGTIIPANSPKFCDHRRYKKFFLLGCSIVALMPIAFNCNRVILQTIKERPKPVRLWHHAHILEPILSTELGGAYKKFDKSELLKFWAEFDNLDIEKPKRGLFL